LKPAQQYDCKPPLQVWSFLPLWTLLSVTTSVSSAASVRYGSVQCWDYSVTNLQHIPGCKTFQHLCSHAIGTCPLWSRHCSRDYGIDFSCNGH
jgi:hypothetical protein